MLVKSPCGKKDRDPLRRLTEEVKTEITLLLFLFLLLLLLFLLLLLLGLTGSGGGSSSSGSGCSTSVHDHVVDVLVGEDSGEDCRPERLDVKTGSLGDGGDVLSLYIM